MSSDSFSEARLYSVGDAAKLCGSISTRTLRRYISNGSVQVTRIGRRVFLRSEEIERIRREGLPSLAVQPQDLSVAQEQESPATK